MPEAIKTVKPGWKTYRFDQIATNVNERIDKPSESVLTHYVGLEHLDPGTLKITRWGTPDDVEATKLIFRRGDIIFGRRRAYQRKLGVAEFDGICSAHAMVLRPQLDIALPEFLPLFMLSNTFMDRAVRISVGSLSPTINLKTLAAENFSLPSIEEQGKIVDTMRRFSAQDDAYEDLLKAAIDLLAARGMEAFSNEKLELIPLQAVLIRQPQSGLYKPEEFLGRGTKIVNMGELFGFDQITSSIDMKLIDTSKEELEKYALTTSDLLFGRRSIVLEGAGRCALVSELKEPVVFESSILRVTVDSSKVLPTFIFEWLRSPRGVQQMKKIRSFTTVAGIAGSDLRRVLIPSLSMSEQMTLVDELTFLRSSVNAIASRRQETRAVQKRVLEAILGGTDVQ